MRLSEFRRAVTEEFGSSYGDALLRDLVLGELGDMTSEQALGTGVPPAVVWRALCRDNDVPETRMHGVGLRSR